MKRVSVNYRSPTFIIGLCLTGLLGVSILATKGRNWSPKESANPANIDPNSPSAVLELADTEPESRQADLQAIAASGDNLLDQSRARYLLAMAHLEAYEGGAALEQLENLEKDYPVLAPHIFIKRGRAHELSNDPAAAQSTWQQVLKRYPESPAAAEALYRLSQYDDKYIEQAIAQYPAHPRTQALIRAQLDNNPDQLKLLVSRLLYDADASDIGTVRERLVNNYSDQLTPEVWEAIGDSFWDSWDYGQAAKAYEKAPTTSRNLYRVARGFHISNEERNARRAYRTLIEKFPDAEETGLGLRRLATLVKDTEALAYLDQAYQKFPEEAPEALFSKANILEKLGSAQSADQARKMALNGFKSHGATSEYRWQQAERYAKEGRFDRAWEWAQPIAVNTPSHSLAAESVFWIGKWAERLNRPEEAEQAFNTVIADYPESYYAWRSAVQLGWDVGNFTSVRDLQPNLAIPKTRPLPPAGSETFQELYRLGQDFDAWNEIQMELAAKPELTIEEEFTAGLLKLTQGRYLKGINTIWGLSQRDEPGDRQAWLELRQRPDYWYALFPFPYADQILKHSADNELNPLLVVSLMRQESRFEKEIQSPVGATGLMQVMPATGEWIADQIDDTEYSLNNPEDNIQFGTWYLRYTHREYDDNSMLAIASYNAGPGNVAKWVRRFDTSDPDFFVEQIPFNETKGYVEAVFANYWNYKRLYDPDLQKKLKEANVF
ncbi:transglycosylase SLT domain-containing protein [[Limnothrix rosea] IAM M-220]|uniref:lytic transglycosylase domain-containing protein n=1 Tax=[Limnothrix rosea] IAM M-220 TaxID=454133 RepID=UPI000961D7C6|nr:transglycosylase SLT domain-containing protein [[Limnothrix rosea] IAM M-220]OKH19039.1 tail length tape measure protein [[Limnothrix rosea] IAM M-220]